MSNSLLNFAVIYGSVRQNRQGIKLAKFLQKSLVESGHYVDLIDPMIYKLPLLDKMYKEFTISEAPQVMKDVSRMLQNADAFIVVSAEYNHSIPPALKNLLDHFQGEYLKKPSALVTYSAGPFAGVRGIPNLRAIMAELGTITIPTTFPVSGVQDAFDDRGNVLDGNYSRRLKGFVNELIWYAQALKKARKEII